MIYEFALEPRVLYEAAKNQRDFKDFIRLFDVGAPAVISNFPSVSQGTVVLQELWQERLGKVAVNKGCFASHSQQRWSSSIHQLSSIGPVLTKV